ncbi:Mur ligase family protein [Limnochorda pilosa]|uniref:UDP-N-acetylmuramyl-tripeptide synthetases n=1 Tax=Limnochorda pilosa TaxID=1555112 RepID=A0A0K2SGG3_LIMPI|nr:Mur ligase family protein [Limnochorda pilosa]BAS25939.1 UDP-N-acetylmuramyl-tripeptide synthetases [Limnochorda pilosa]
MKRWDDLLAGVPWQACPDRFQVPAADLAVTGIAHDSRRVQPGDLFVAVRGHATDGNRFAAQAERAGAVAVVTDAPESLPPIRIPVGRVDDARLALSRIAASFYGHPAQRLTVVGVTGTLGKTSVTELVAAILAKAGPAYEPGVVGSLGIRFRGQGRGSLLTTPDALTLQHTLAEMATAGVRVVVMEVTSHAQLQHRVSDVSFSLACLLNLVPGEHADIHPSFDHYAAVKLRILDQIRAGGVFLFNAQDPEVVRRLKPRLTRAPYRVAAVHAQPMGHEPASGSRERHRPNDVVPPGLYLDASTQGRLAFDVPGPLPTLEGERPPVRFEAPWALWGEQNRQNAAAATAIALALGVEVEAIVAGLSSATPVRRRMEPVYRGAFQVLDDTTGHPASFEALFRSLSAVPRQGVVLLTAVRGSRGEAVNRANARAIARWAERLPVRAVVVTASAEAVHPKDTVRPEEWQAFREELVRAGVPAAYHMELRQAVQAAVETVRPGEILVLAGAQGLDGATPILRTLLDGKAALPGLS